MSGTIIQNKCSKCGERHIGRECPTCGTVARSIHSRASLEAIAPFQLFAGPAEATRIPAWFLSTIGGCGACGDTDEASERTGVDVFLLSPMRDDDACEGIRNERGEQFYDIDAALSYLNAGGTLCKIPDYEGSKYYRFLVAGSLVL